MHVFYRFFHAFKETADQERVFVELIIQTTIYELVESTNAWTEKQ